MENSSNVIEQLRNDIKLKIGKSLDTPTDFDFLSNQIQQSLKEYISPTTLKRFYNYIPSNVIPRLSTLNVLARFLGYNGWEEYTEGIKSGINLMPLNNNKNKNHNTIQYYNDGSNKEIWGEKCKKRN